MYAPLQHLKWVLQSPETRYSFFHFPTSEYSIEDFAFLDEIDSPVDFKFEKGILFDEEVFYICTEPKKIPKVPSKRQHQQKLEHKPAVKKKPKKIPNHRRTAANCIYLISNGTHQKIGISNNPQKRLKGLQTSSPIKLTCLAVYQSGDYTSFMEKRLHLKFKDNRLEGEWFSTNLTGDEFIDLCKEDHEKLKVDYPLVCDK